MPELSSPNLLAHHKQSPMALHIQRVLAEFDACNVSIADWARLHRFSLTNVYRVLRGEQACKRGEAYRIAVALGLKRGNIMSPEEFDKKLRDGTGLTEIPSLPAKETTNPAP